MQTVQQATQQRNASQQKAAEKAKELAEALRLCPHNAHRLIEPIVFHFASLALNTGTKHPIYRPWRSQLAYLVNRGKRTISRMLSRLVEQGLLIKLPQDKDFKRGIFGPLQLVPSRLLWVLVRSKIRELAARKYKPTADSNRGTKNTSISSPLKERESLESGGGVRVSEKEQKRRQEARELEDERLFQKDYPGQTPDPAMLSQIQDLLKPK